MYYEHFPLVSHIYCLQFCLLIYYYLQYFSVHLTTMATLLHHPISRPIVKYTVALCLGACATFHAASSNTKPGNTKGKLELCAESGTNAVFGVRLITCIITNLNIVLLVAVEDVLYSNHPDLQYGTYICGYSFIHVVQ